MLGRRRAGGAIFTSPRSLFALWFSRSPALWSCGLRSMQPRIRQRRAPAGGGPEACTCVVWDSRADAEDPCGRAVGMSIENVGGSGEASGGSADGGAPPPPVQSEGMSAGAVGSCSNGDALLPREQVEYMSMDVGGASEGGAAGSSSSGGVPPPGVRVEVEGARVRWWRGVKW